MFNYNLVFGFCGVLLLGATAALAATVPPPPLIQTLNATIVGPEFVVIDRKNDTQQIDAAADATNSTVVEGVEDARFWHKVAMKQLVKTIRIAQNSNDPNYKKKAKNIIIFIGDGMGMTTITAGRIFKGQQEVQQRRSGGEEAMLSFDAFPNTGLSKTYNVDKQVPDSASTATAMFCGSKTDYGAIGMDTTRSKTDASKGRLRSIMDWAQDEGKRTGIVTTTRITHATPAATYAHIYHRDWECDSKVPPEARGQHADIARQLVEQAPGNRFNVILGGGLSPMGTRNVNELQRTIFAGDTEKVCARADNRNLVQEWLNIGGDSNGAGANDSRRVFVQTSEELSAVNGSKVEHLLGLFRNNHITYALAREKGEPSLREMTEAAIAVLERGAESKGYVLMVEGGRIDQAHHQNYARAALQEVLELDTAIEAALNMTDSRETLIIVTADHSHAVTLNGYPKRGADILGFANRTNDPMAYETITYANGPGYWEHLDNSTGGGGVDSNKSDSYIVWRPLDEYSTEERMSPTYRHLAALPLKDESHGGEDVAVFAHGPGATLVRGVFEQNFLAYLMSYTACMGPAKEYDDTCRIRETSAAAAAAAAAYPSIRWQSLPAILFILSTVCYMRVF